MKIIIAIAIEKTLIYLNNFIMIINLAEKLDTRAHEKATVNQLIIIPNVIIKKGRILISWYSIIKNN